MAENALSVDQPSTPTPPEHAERSSSRQTTVKPTDPIERALDRLFNYAESLEKQHRGLKADTDGKARELKALGVTPGEPVSAEKLPLNRELCERAVSALKRGKLKVKEFQEKMGFFDTSALARVRKALIAARITIETAEGSVVFVALTGEFASQDAE